MTQKVKFSVIIPLYNKQAEIAATLESVLAQRYAPCEIIVVDDGSTDGSAEIVRSFDAPLIKLVMQPNGGGCRARNRAMQEATGHYFALLDGDDRWHADYLAEMARLINNYPGCGLYCSGFNIVTRKGVVPAPAAQQEGIVEDFFRTSLQVFVAITSATTLSREVFETVGGFPDGMAIGGDQYMWMKAAAAGFRVCYTPQRLCNYSTVATNRTPSLYKGEKTRCSPREFYREGEFYRNEFIAKFELGKAITISAKGGDAYARDVEKFYAWTRLNRRALLKLKIINRLPRRLRPAALRCYNRLGWVIARKGLYHD